MGNQSKRDGKRKTSELVVETAMSMPALLAAVVHDGGGSVKIPFEVLAKVADELQLDVSPVEDGVLLVTRYKPEIVRPGLVVPEGLAGIADLGEVAEMQPPEG